jgi:hypothetical protein
MITKIFEKEVNNLLKDVEKQPRKKIFHVIEPLSLIVLLPKILTGKMMCSRSIFGRF